MKELEWFGLPVFIDESSYELKFEEDIICEDSNVKTLRQMKDLLYDKSIADEKDEVCYIYYFNIIRPKDRMKFKEKGFTNGITVLMPGTMKGECRKTPDIITTM